jgi:HEAT repeat protein
MDQTSIHIRRSLEHIRRRLSRLFMNGLSNVLPSDLDKIKNSIVKLGLSGNEGEILNEITVKLDYFAATTNNHERFKLATKMVLALDQISLRKLATTRFVAKEKSLLDGNKAIYISESNIPSTAESTVSLIRSGHGIVELIQYVRSSRFKPETATIDLLIPLLTHSSLRAETIGRLRKLPENEQAALGKTLLGMKNKLLCISGIELLAKADCNEGWGNLMNFPDRPYALALVREELRSNHFNYQRPLYDAIKKLAEEKHSRHLESLSSLMHLVKPAPDDIGTIKELEKSDNIKISSYATIALLKVGNGDERLLKQQTSNLDNDILRIYSKVFLHQKGIIDDKYVLSEFNSDDENAHKIAFDAMEDLGQRRLMDLIKPLIEEAIYGSSPSVRSKYLAKIISGRNSLLIRDVFLPAAFDTDKSVSTMAKNRLIELSGFEAMALFFDTSSAIFSDPEKLGLEALHYINYYLVPHIAHTGDCRFTRFLNHLVFHYSSKKQQYDYENSIKPILINFGEPLIDFLAEDLFANEPSISLAAEELLIEIGGKEADKARSSFNSGAPPVEMAYRQLGNPRTSANARQVILNEGKSTVPHLIELLSDPRYREEAMTILAQFQAPESFPALLKLLGNPSSDMLMSGDISVILRDTGLADRPITKHIITIGDPIIDSLVEKLSESNWTIRYHAALILGEIGNSRAVPELIRLYHRESDSLEVIGAIIKSFGLMGTSEAVSLLKEHIEDPSREIRYETYRALGRIGSMEAIACMKDALSKCQQLNDKRLIQKAIEEAESPKQ